MKTSTSNNEPDSNSEPDWKYATCPVCLKGFTAKSWDKRHTWLVDGESDIHDHCCRCQGRHDAARTANRVNDAARWAISKPEELCDRLKDADKQLDFAIRVFKEGCEAPDRITVTFPGWTKI